MITLTKAWGSPNANVLEFSGKSTDTKPIGDYQGLNITNGSEYKEIDTGNTYSYDAEGSIWYLNNTTTSGGGGGANGITPHIGENGNWFIGTVDTGVSAQGPAGENGVTPHIGTNGNWYIGSANTGVPAKGAKGDNGLDGNGIKSAILNSDYTLTLTFDDDTTYTTPSIRGATGSAGKDGTDGVGISSIKQTTTSTADGGNNVFTVTLTNGTTATFTVKNGSKGSTGKDGSNGVDGGYYTPGVTQPTTDTMQISFAPSKPDMPAVNTVTVNLPVSENSGQNPVQSDLSQNDPTQPDYVKHRTHYEENNQTVIEWDGSTEGRESFALAGDFAGAVLYKVHNDTPTQDELVGGVLCADNGDEVEEVLITADVFEATAGFNAVNCLLIGPLLIVYGTEISLLGETYTLQSTGIFAATYFRKLTYGSTTVHPLDEKWIPDSIARKTDIGQNLSLDTTLTQSGKAADAKAVGDALAKIEAGQGVNWMYVTEEVEDEIPCTGISLDKSALNFTGAGQQTIVATVTPADTTDTLVWTSSKPSVATVANGVVTAYANGSATITATCGEYSASCTVEVSGISSTVAVTGITLDKATATVQAGSTITLTATVKPDNATNKTVLWSSDDETVATVENGVVTGVSEGTASIGAMTADGGFSAVCNVTVAAASKYKNLFDKDTMVVGGGIRYDGIIASNWGMAKVPVKENTVYSLKTTDATADVGYYGAPTAGSIGFADSTGNTLIYNLILGDPSRVETNGINADLKEYAHGNVKGYGGNDGTVEWVTFTTPAGCAYLLFNTTLKNNADKIQLEEGDTIHNYYLPYNGGAE